MRDKAILIKVTSDEQTLIQARAKELGFNNTSDYVRYISINTKTIPAREINKGL
jgi:hypothetical protein